MVHSNPNAVAERNAATELQRREADAQRRAAVAPAVDVFEDKNGITVLADLPGVPRDKLDVKVHDGNLTIDAEAVVPTRGSLSLQLAEVREPRFSRAFVLSPELSNVHVTITAGDGTPADQPRAGHVTADIAPAVGKRQRVTLLLNEFDAPDTRPARAYRFVVTSHSQPTPPATTPPDTSPSLTMPFVAVLPANYLVRVQVDGAESPLDVDGAGKLATPQVNIS